nr:hypothetical protein CFP56_16653 [Quercus suber]
MATPAIRDATTTDRIMGRLRIPDSVAVVDCTAWNQMGKLREVVVSSTQMQWRRDWRDVLVHQSEECSTTAEHEERAPRNAPLGSDPRRDRGKVLLPELDADKDQQEHAEDDEEGDDRAVVPRVLAAAPLQGQEQTDDHGEEDEGADDIELFELGLPADGHLLRASGGLVEDQDEERRHRSDGQIDVETPAPADLAAHRKGAHWSARLRDKRRNAVHGPDGSGVGRSLAQRHRVGDDEDGAAEDARAAQTRDGTADDQGIGVGRSSADCGTDLEDEDADQEDPLDGEVGIELAKGQLEGTGRQQIGTAVPAHVARGLELVGDARDGGGDDGVVEGHAKDGQAQGDRDQGQLASLGIVDSLVV